MPKLSSDPLEQLLVTEAIIDAYVAERDARNAEAPAAASPHDELGARHAALMAGAQGEG